MKHPLFLLPLLMIHALKQTVTCKCGKVKLAIDSQDALRLVCYCKDCRGYHQTLNQKAAAEHKQPAAPLDDWGGVDWTTLYPNEIRVLQGQDHLTTRVLHPKSPMYRVYATCCYTPMFSLGQAMGSALLNTNLIVGDEKPDVRFRIMGRQALRGDDDGGKQQGRPKMSWSVPLSWFWVMCRRIHKDRMTPSPVPAVGPSEPAVLEGFQEG